MEDYNKIIESLGIKYIEAKNIDIVQPVTVKNFYDVDNTLILLNKGQIIYGEDNQVLEEGDFLFVPSRRTLSITYNAFAKSTINDNASSGSLDKYFTPSSNNRENGNFSYVTFDAKVFDSVNFFQSLDIPYFSILDHDPLRTLVGDLLNEIKGSLPGKERVIKMITDRIVIETVRYILENNLFVEKLATNVTYFKDPRLLDIFAYIRENINGDLSNKNLATIANVSEDYVGQYFKMLTGINPQDYIEYQRMERAIDLLRTTKRSVREIGREVGYKDTAYFCRRFKMMFGIPAGKMRKRESLMNF